MDLTAFSLEAAQNSLREVGFHDFNDSRVGDLVLKMEEKGFPFLSPYGLDYCKNHIFDDRRIQDTIESLLRKCTLGHWLRYKELPGHIECFRRGGINAGLHALVIQQWSPGSRMKYFSGSHVHDLPTEKGERSLYETTQAALSGAGCTAVEKDFPNGGLTICDARLCAEIEHGYAVTFIFATDDVLASWPKIILPNSLALIRKVVNMETPIIRVNFAIRDRAGATNR